MIIFNYTKYIYQNASVLEEKNYFKDFIIICYEFLENLYKF